MYNHSFRLNYSEIIIVIQCCLYASLFVFLICTLILWNSFMVIMYENALNHNTIDGKVINKMKY